MAEGIPQPANSPDDPRVRIIGGMLNAAEAVTGGRRRRREQRGTQGTQPTIPTAIPQTPDTTRRQPQTPETQDKKKEKKKRTDITKRNWFEHVAYPVIGIPVRWLAFEPVRVLTGAAIGLEKKILGFDPEQEKRIRDRVERFLARDRLSPEQREAQKYTRQQRRRQPRQHSTGDTLRKARDEILNYSVIPRGKK